MVKALTLVGEQNPNHVGVSGLMLSSVQLGVTIYFLGKTLHL